MRFGFFFFAEYVNVFIVSALTVTLFFGGWNAPFNWPWPVDAARSTRAASDPAAAPGRGHPAGRAIARPRRAVLAVPLGCPAWQALIIGFVLFNLVVVGASWAGPSSASTGSSGLLWFMLKTYAFVFTFVWMRGTLPRVRIDQLMGLRLEVAAARLACSTCS